MPFLCMEGYGLRILNERDTHISSVLNKTTVGLKDKYAVYSRVVHREYSL